jgi:hypothetical protein
VSVKSNSICFIDVFVQEIHGGRVTDEHMLQCLVEQMCDSAANPIKVGTKDLYDGMCTELAVVASVDAGGRGRPKVTPFCGSSRFCSACCVVYNSRPIRSEVC